MARLFNGSSDYIVTGSPSWTSRFSMSAWFFVVGAPGVNSGLTILSNTTGSSLRTGYRFAYQNDSGTLKLTMYWTLTDGGGNDTLWSYTPSPVLSLNTWYHLAWTFNSAGGGGFGVAAVYLNGMAYTPVMEYSNPGVNALAFGQPRIGCLYSTANANAWFWNGRLAEIAFFGDNCNPVLNAGEALTLYRGGYFVEIRPTWPTNHYQGAWPLEGWDTTEPDWSGNGRHSTTISGTTQAVGPPTAWYPPLIPGWFNSTGDANNPEGCPPIASISTSVAPVATFDPLAIPYAVVSIQSAPVAEITCPPGGGVRCH